MQEEKHPAVYILAHRKDGVLYVGVTSALWNRVNAHKDGTIKGFTQQYNVKQLVWFEHHPSMPSAIHSEKRLKKWPRAWKLNLVNAMNPDWQDLHEHIDANINLVEEFASRKVVAK